MDSILDDIDRHVRETPHGPCISEDRWRVDYAEMATITDGLAATLVQATGRSGGCVVWIGGSGAPRLLAFIAVLKAGQMFCAPDLSLNDRQIRAILKVSNYDLALVEPGFEAEAERHACAPTLLASFKQNAGPGFQRPKIEGSAPARLSITSGSTGMPKILILNREQMEHFVRLSCDLQQLTASDTIGLLGHFWSASLFTGLSVGAETACFDLPRLGAADLARWMQAEAVTAVMTYPAVFRELMAAGRRLPDLRSIVLAGEALTRADAEAHARLCSARAELVGTYGSMEYAYLTAWRRQACDPIEFEVMPMGREIVPGETYLIDEAGSEIPEGATGELEIRSFYLPREYLGDPALTRERFRALPDGRVALRTGDLAYRDFAGIYHFMGRRDQQTKIRGYNVRPADVEMVIQRQAGIAEAVVVARDSARGIRRLVCFFTGAADIGILRETLSEELPGYMVPSVWHRVESLPKTHSGKVIRGALPDPFVKTMPLRQEDFRSDVERDLARLFAEILETTDFGRDDDFFDLGGDSLQAMRLVIEVEAQRGRRIPLDSLILKGANVAALARHFDEAAAGPTILREGKGGDTLVLTHGVGGHLSDYLEVVHFLEPRLRVVGATMNADRQEGLPLTMQEMAARSLECLGEEVSQPHRFTILGFSFGAPIAVEMARILAGWTGETPPIILVDPLAPWLKSGRWVRPILRNVRHRKLAEARRLLRRNVRAALGVRPSNIDDALNLAWLRYRPEPFRAPEALIIATGMANSETGARAWSEIFSSTAEIIRTGGDHATMMTGEHAGPLAQVIQKWISHASREAAGDQFNS